MTDLAIAETLLAPARRRRIVEMLGRQEFVTHAQIRSATGTSIATVRRDLALLERAGALIRVRGGVTRPQPVRGEAAELMQILLHALNTVRHGDMASAELTLRRALRSCQRLCR